MKTSLQIKFIIDVGVGHSIEEWLSENFTILSIASINTEMSDREILELAYKEGAIIITMDKDFGELVFKDHTSPKSVSILSILFFSKKSFR